MQNRFRTLFDTLCQARVATSPSAADVIQHRLQHYKPDFLRLLDDLPKNTQDRTELQSGKATINGTVHKVNEEFVKQSIFLSDQLGINENIAAELIMKGMIEAPRVNSTAVDTAIVEYYNERGYVLQCLEMMVTCCKDASTNKDVQFVFAQFISDIMQDRTSGNKSFVSKVLTTIKDLSTAITNLKNAGSIQLPQQQQQQQQQQQPQLGQNTADTGGRLGEYIMTLRIERLEEERITLAQILYHLTSMHWIDPQDVMAIEEILEQAQLTDVATSYLLLSLLGALSITDHLNYSMHVTPPLYNNADFMTRFQNKMTGSLWKVPAIKSVVVLQWVLFLYRAVQEDQSVEGRLPAKEEQLEELVEGAINSKAFEFMNDYLLYFQQPNASIETQRGTLKASVYEDTNMILDGLMVDPSDYTKFNAKIRGEFQTFVVHEIEQLAVDFIENLQNVLRKLKYKEEDTSTPAHAPLSTRNALASTEEDSSKCHDLESFMELLASIYRGRVNMGWKFWTRTDSRLFGFIKWATDIKVSGTVRACYSFLASISTGDVCAPRAFNHLATGTNTNDLAMSSLFSWGKLFAAIQFYVPLLRNTSKDAPAAFPADEEELLKQFLHLLKQVVQYSMEARKALWFDTLLRAPQSIFEMISCDTSVELRAALFDVLAAFCSPWGGGVEGVGRSISELVWEALDTNGFLVSKREPVQGQQELGDQRPAMQRLEAPKPPGFLRELAMERNNKVYPETLALLNLIGSAIHTVSKREELLNGFQYMPSTISWDLGKGTRTPGAEPFISLVIDHIFIGLESQEYIYPGSKWQLSEACLKILENSIRSFNLRPLRQALSQYRNLPANHPQSRAAAQGSLEHLLLMYLGHPGFTVIVRLLSGHRLVNEMLKIVEAGPDGIMAKKESSPYFVQCVIRCLRIIHQVLELQDTFCNMLVPSVTGLSSRMASSEFKIGDVVFPPMPSLVSFGQIMLYHANALVQLGLLVNCEDQEEICYLSTKILNALSTEPLDSNVARSGGNIHAAMGGIGTKLAKVLRGCKDETRILYGISERLGIDDEETTTPEDYEYDINNIPFWCASKTLDDKFSFDSDFQPSMACSVRLALVDLLLNNSMLDKPSPSLVDFIFGYSESASDINITLQRMRNDVDLRICFQSFMNLINRGIIRHDDSSDVRPPLVATHPVLAEKCYKLIYRVCTKESTSSSTMRYLRGNEDFFYRHLEAMPARLENYHDIVAPVFPGVLVSLDGSRSRMDFFSVCSQLHQRAWLLKSVALELHIMAGSHQKSDIKRLLELLYGRHDDTHTEDMVEDTERESVNIFAMGSHRFQQPLVKMLEVLSSLEFEWIDDLADGSNVGELVHFKGFDYKQYEIQNERDCTVFDIRSIYQVLRQAERQKQDSGELANDQQRMELENEMGRILKVLMAENHKREIAQGKLHCLRAWKQVVQVTLSECFDLFPFETREKIIYDLLLKLLAKIKEASGTEPDILKGFSEVILTLLTRLREDKLRQEILEASPSPSTNVESSRLPEEKLRVIFSGIIDCIREDNTLVRMRGDMYTALVNFLHYVSHNSSKSSSIQSQFVNIIAANEKFLTILCADASDGVDVWKTTAYILLDALYVMSTKASNEAILAFLVKKNFLRYSIDMIRRDDVALLNLLEQSDASMVPLYIYEAKMSLFLRLSLCKQGAKLLIENRIVDVLSHCQFIGARPEAAPYNNDRMQTEVNFNERYDRLIMPALKLISAVLCTLGRSNGVVIDKVESWCRMQQEAVLFILKDEHQQTTLSSLAQLKHITSILYHLSSRPGFFDDLVNRRMSHLHTAMVHLIAKYLVPQNLSAKVVPSTDEEKQWALKKVNNDASVLSTKAADTILSIQMSLAAYAQNAAFTTDDQCNNSFKPLFSSTLASTSDSGASVTRNASLKTPSLSTLTSCIRQTTSSLYTAAAERKRFETQKNNVGSIKLEEVRELAQTAFSQTLSIHFDHLGPSQQQQVLIAELDKRSKLKAKQMRHLVFLLENVLLVLWRHLEYYMQSTAISQTTAVQPLDLYSSQSFAVSSQTAMFQPSMAIASNLKTSSTTTLTPLLKKLETLNNDIPELQASASSVHGLCTRINKIIA